MWFFCCFRRMRRRSVRERGRAEATAAAAGAQPVCHVAGDGWRRWTTGQREFQRERTPNADGRPQRQTVQRPVQSVPQEEGHQPVNTHRNVLYNLVRMFAIYPIRV